MDNYLIFRKNLGQKIKKIREAKKLSQEFIALEIDVDKSFIGRIERGERNVGLENLYKIAKILNISLYNLVNTEKE